MQVSGTDLPGVFVLEPKRFGDARGFFVETWNAQRLQDAGFDFDFVQDNCSFSAEVGTLRGLHYQSPPHAQTKLVSCLQGAIYDVVVDARRGSPTYGQHFGIELSFQNGLQLLVPKGFLHGFVTRTPDAVIAYKVDAHYSSTCDGSVLWSSCGIDWGLDGDPVLSDKDNTAPLFADFDTPFSWEAS